MNHTPLEVVRTLRHDYAQMAAALELLQAMLEEQERVATASGDDQTTR